MRLPAPVRASEVAAAVGGELHGEDRVILGVAPLEDAGPGDLAYRLPDRRGDDNAGLLLADAPIAGRSVVVVGDSLAALIPLLESWFPEPAPCDARISPDARIGAGVKLHSGVVVGPGAEVADETVLFPNVVLYPGTRVGRRCRVHAGTVLGADGFRYHASTRGLLKVPQVGGVRIGDDVELGALVTIDRGFLGDTVIGDGCKIDNLVQIGHNCKLGRSVVIAAQTGLSGSCVIGDGVLMGGQVGLADHSYVGAGARLGTRSGVRGQVPAGETWLGAPAMPIGLTMRIFAASRDLPEMWRTWMKARPPK